MCWPLFPATLISARSTYWIRRLYQARILHQPQWLAATHRSRALYTDATTTSVVSFAPGPSQRSCVQHYTDQQSIASVKMEEAFRRFIWYKRQLSQPATLTLCTESAVVYYTLAKGTGLILRSLALFQTLYFYKLLKLQAGHALVFRWVPSDENQAYSLTREYPPYNSQPDYRRRWLWSGSLSDNRWPTETHKHTMNNTPVRVTNDTVRWSTLQCKATIQYSYQHYRAFDEQYSAMINTTVQVNGTVRWSTL
jgi:hypothetical protein